MMLSRAAARRLKIACWEVSQTLGTERKGANTWTDACKRGQTLNKTGMPGLSPFS